MFYVLDVQRKDDIKKSYRLFYDGYVVLAINKFLLLQVIEVLELFVIVVCFDLFLFGV